MKAETFEPYRPTEDSWRFATKRLDDLPHSWYNRSIESERRKVMRQETFNTATIITNLIVWSVVIAQLIHFF